MHSTPNNRKYISKWSTEEYIEKLRMKAGDRITKSKKLSLSKPSLDKFDRWNPEFFLGPETPKK